MFQSALPLLVAVVFTGAATAAEVAKGKPLTMADVLASSEPSDWRPLDPENTIYLELSTGRVVFELAPTFAPQHVANIKALAREHYYDGLAIIRAQDNYVVQWGDADVDKPESARTIHHAKKTLAAEFDRSLDKRFRSRGCRMGMCMPARLVFPE